MGALGPSRHVRAHTVLRAPTFILQCYGRQHLPSDMNHDGNIRQPLRFKKETHVIYSNEHGASMLSTPHRVMTWHPGALRRPLGQDMT